MSYALALSFLFLSVSCHGLSHLREARTSIGVQKYSRNETTLGQCRRWCGGFQVASVHGTYVWALPFSGFVIPAVVFSMVVPRQTALKLLEDFLEGTVFGGLALLFVILFAYAL